MLDPGVGVLTDAVSRDHHLARVDGRQRPVPALKDVPRSGHEEIVA